MSATDDYFEKQKGAVRQIALALRDHINLLAPELTCALAWNFPCWSGQQRILSVIAHKGRCNLQLFYGAQLAELFPARIEGTGKALRHVKIRSVSDIDDELDQIILAAVDLDQRRPERVR